MSADLEAIEESILRYQRLRKHQDKEFARRVLLLKQWQHQRMQITYATLLKDRSTADLVSYFLEDIYKGIDLSDIARSLSKSLGIAGKLFTDLSLIRLALAFNTLNGEIDQRVTEILSPQCLTQLTEEEYVKACEEAAVIEDHLTSIALIGEFAVGLDATVHNPVVYGAFKVAKLPAKLAGLGNLYGLLDKGFSAIRAMPEAEATIQRIVSHETWVHQRMKDHVSPCFLPLTE